MVEIRKVRTRARAEVRPSWALVGMALALGCTTVELGKRAPLEGASEELIGGSYTFERAEVGSISGCTATLVGPRLVSPTVR